MSREDFVGLYAEHGDRLLRLAVVVSGRRDGAEDVVAETFARCWRRWRRHVPDEPAAYLRRTLLNELIRRGEREGRTSSTRDVVAPVDPTAAVADRVWALGLLGELPARQRAVLALRFLDDRSEAETAELLSMPVGTVKSTSARALARLGQMLADGADHEGRV